MIAWTGWSLAGVLAAFAGFGAAVTALYFLRLRRREVRVAWLPLWERVLAEERRTRLFDRLKRLWSLALALLLVALLSAALGDPRAPAGEGRTLVVLVDASASMRATDVAPSRFEAARARVRALVDDLGPNDRMIVAELGATALPRSPLTGDRRLLHDAVDALESHATEASARAGLRFALDVLRGAPSPEVVVVTDGALGEAATGTVEGLAEAGVRLSWIPVGGAADNVAVSAFAVRRYPLDKTQAEVLVELWNPGERPREVELQLVSDGVPLDVVPVTLPPGERVRRFFENVSGADRTLEARVAPSDGLDDRLPVDDVAYARVPERRRARVLVVTEGNLYLEAALLLDEYLDVTTVAPAAYGAGPGADGAAAFDAVIFDRALPPAPPRAHAFYLRPAGAGAAPLEADGVVERPYFDRVDEQHPLVFFAALRDVNVGEALRLVPRADDTVVAADAASAPLLVAGERDGYKMAALAFDLGQSDLPLRVAWPLLLLHAIDWFTDEDAAYLSSFRTGETWRIPVPAGADRAAVEAPDGSTRVVAVREGRAVHAGEEVGFHRVRAAGAEDVIAANLGPGEESLLRAAPTLTLGGVEAGAPSAGSAAARRDAWWILVAAALGLVAFEWLAHHRRWTV